MIRRVGKKMTRSKTVLAVARGARTVAQGAVIRALDEGRRATSAVLRARVRQARGWVALSLSRHPLRRTLTAVSILIGLGCGGEELLITQHDDLAARAVSVQVGDQIAEVDERYLSVAIDTSQLVGGPWWSEAATPEAGGGETLQPQFDFRRKKLRLLAGELAPALVRLGGTEADRIYYDLSDEPGAAPEGFERVLTKSQWNEAASFAKELGFELMFTLNAGPGPRGKERAWDSSNASKLIEYAAARKDPVYVWELGNEVHAFPIFFGLGFRVKPAQYAEDLLSLKRVVQQVHPEALVAGPASAFWPEVGEMPSLYPKFVQAGGRHADVLTWHYYPQQSSRCVFRVTPAHADRMHDPRSLNEVARWAQHVEALREDHAPEVPVWLGESGNAQCGGHPGLSDTFESGFWWLDQLGILAQRGQPIQVRQSLTGASYGLLSEPDLTPRPDYYTSVLWKRLMGTQVLKTAALEKRALRSYAQCTPNQPGAVTLLLVNLDREAGAFAFLEGISASQVAAYRLESRDDGRGIALNGLVLQLDRDGNLPTMAPVFEHIDPMEPQVYLPANSYGFFVLEDAQHPACFPPGFETAQAAEPTAQS